MITLLARLSVSRPVTVVMTFLALLLLGAIAWEKIPVEMMPGRFSLNRMWVYVPYQDSTPRETEQQVVRPMEEHLAKLAMHAAPGAIQDAKRLVLDLAGLEINQALSHETAKRIAARRASEEGREGLSSFLEKRKPYWVG